MTRLILLAIVLGLGAAPPAAAQLFGPKRHTVVIGGVERTYYLHIPEKLRAHPGRAPGQASVHAPLVLILHGGAGRARRMARFTGFNRLADRHGFMVAYPQGLKRRWNDGRVGKSPANDVGYLTGLVRHLVRTTGRINRRRVFAAGISNGGFMAMRLACEATGTFLAVAAVTAQFTTWLKPRCRADRPISVLFMNGTRDPLVPYDGGVIAPQFGGLGHAASTGDTVAYWVRHNRCAKPTTTALPNRRRLDFSRVERTAWAGCRGGSRVVLYKVIGGGHTWPGAWQYLAPAVIGWTNRDIDGSRVIWRFFSRLAPRSGSQMNQVRK